MEFILPIQRRNITKISQNSPAHRGQLKNAIDFYCPQGTFIHAIADGTIIKTRDDSNRGGRTKDYWYDGNFILIKHNDVIYSWYEHLKFKGVLVIEGEAVKQGDKIGLSGATGFLWTPHLHLEVRQYHGSNIWSDFKTFLPKFKEW